MKKGDKKKFTHRILLAEDEDGIRRGVKLNLEADGYAVDDYPDAASALAAAVRRSGRYSLGIFDVMMPGGTDGTELCRQIRAKGYVFPVIFLTAKNRLNDKLEGFSAGGDDYLTKPFDLEELLARVKARLTIRMVSEDIRIGDFVIDLDARTATHTETGDLVRFNERETGILRLLIENRGRPVSRQMIMASAWDAQAESPTNRTIDNYIVKFRKIFEKSPHNPEMFITRHGTGYELSKD